MNCLALFLCTLWLVFASVCLAQNPDCTVTVPPQPLTATGLATPYFLAGFNQATAGACNQLNPAQTAFVQGAVFDQTNAKISIYNPLIVDVGTAPAIAPVVPKLPAQSVVGLWFGFNGNRLFLLDNGGSLTQGQCVNAGGADFTAFGAFAHCNAQNWFQAVNSAIQFQGLAIPGNGIGRNGLPCPTLRDFTAIDQDQSDGVTTSYLVANGLLAQDTPQNRVTLGITQANLNLGTNLLAQSAGDNRLITQTLGGALGCFPWMNPDLAAQGQGAVTFVSALPTNELYAAANTKAPFALVPLNDPLVKVNGMTQPDLNKVNAYRLGVNQPIANTAVAADPNNYCLRYYNLAPPRIMLDRPFTNLAGTSPNRALANTLFGYLVVRANNAVAPANLNCGLAPPFTFQVDAAGVIMEDTVALNPNAVVATVVGLIKLTGNVQLDILQGNGDLVKQPNPFFEAQVDEVTQQDQSPSQQQQQQQQPRKPQPTQLKSGQQAEPESENKSDIGYFALMVILSIFCGFFMGTSLCLIRARLNQNKSATSISSADPTLKQVPALATGNNNSIPSTTTISSTRPSTSKIV